jgi:hypothetical protein
VTKVYYPAIDSPQIRDMQFLVTDGETFFHDERTNFVRDIDCISVAALGFEVTNREKEGRCSIHKTVLGDPPACAGTGFSITWDGRIAALYFFSTSYRLAGTSARHSTSSGIDGHNS